MGAVDPWDAEALLDRAEAAVLGALAGRAGGGPPDPGTGGIASRRGRAFVTLTVDGALNGCIGSLDPSEPLAESIPRLARAAAFEDPRLPPLRPEDLPGLEIEVSLLSSGRRVPALTREALRGAVRRGVDGLLISVGHHRALFLPDVWAKLPDPDDFLDHLLAKAGLPSHPWPAGLQAEVFTTTAMHRRVRHPDRPGATMPAWPSGPNPVG